MAGALRKTMVYLGLAEDDERYDGYDEYDYDEPAARSEAPAERSAAVTPLPQRTPVARVVRDVEVGALNRITTIHPRTYNEAKNIGECFRDGTPVIMNLSDMDDSDAKRLVDFAAGLVFGLHGSDRAGHLQGVPAVAGARRGLGRGGRPRRPPRPAACSTRADPHSPRPAAHGRVSPCSYPVPSAASCASCCLPLLHRPARAAGAGLGPGVRPATGARAASLLVVAEVVYTITDPPLQGAAQGDPAADARQHPARPGLPRPHAGDHSADGHRLDR